MKFLERSKSLRAKEISPYGANVTTGLTQQPVVVEEKPAVSTLKSERRRSRWHGERSKSSESRLSFHRPRTANKTTEPEVSTPRLAEDLAKEMEVKAGNATFSFPSPSARIQPSKVATFSAQSPLNDKEISPGIGVALGSPTQPPKWGRSHTEGTLNSTMMMTDPRAEAPIFPEPDPKQGPQLRKQKSRWGRLGGLFQRNGSKDTVQETLGKTAAQVPPTGAERMRMQQSANMAPAVSPEPRSDSAYERPRHTRQLSANRGMARLEARAEADRALFMPGSESKMRRTPSMIHARNSASLASPVNWDPSRPSQDTIDVFRSMNDKARQHNLSPPQPAANGRSPRTPKLDLDLPDVKMERYSVMFEKLLEPKESLLERRQSKIKRLNSSKGKDSAHNSPASHLFLPTSIANPPPSFSLPHRSATSPTFRPKAPIPDLSIYVTDSNTSTVHRARPLQRSRTAPPNSVSPARANFSRPRIAQAQSQAQVPSLTLASPESTAYSENSLPPTPTSADSTKLVETDSNDPILIPTITVSKRPQKTSKPEIQEPSWDMLTSSATDHEPLGSPPPPMPALPRSVTMPAALSTAKPPAIPDRSPNRTKNHKERDARIVQVSVARQVSVSKARRTVQAAQISQRGYGPLRPRVVEVGKGGEGGEGVRKSTVVLIEGGSGSD